MEYDMEYSLVWPAIGDPILATQPPERWDAPDLATAERWADEVNGRGGRAEVISAWSGIASRWYVRVIIPATPS